LRGFLELRSAAVSVSYDRRKVLRSHRRNDSGVPDRCGDYNAAKHNRDANFRLPTLGNVLDAVSAVLPLLFSQFQIHSFDAHHLVYLFHRDGSCLSDDYRIFCVEPAGGLTPRSTTSSIG
jgi:hypothetical protein